MEIYRRGVLLHDVRDKWKRNPDPGRIRKEVPILGSAIPAAGGVFDSVEIGG